MKRLNLKDKYPQTRYIWYEENAHRADLQYIWDTIDYVAAPEDLGRMEDTPKGLLAITGIVGKRAIVADLDKAGANGFLKIHDDAEEDLGGEKRDPIKMQFGLTHKRKGIVADFRQFDKNRSIKLSEQDIETLGLIANMTEGEVEYLFQGENSDTEIQISDAIRKLLPVPQVASLVAAFICIARSHELENPDTRSGMEKIIDCICDTRSRVNKCLPRKLTARVRLARMKRNQQSPEDSPDDN